MDASLSIRQSQPELPPAASIERSSTTPASPLFLLGIATAAFVADALSKLWAVIALEVQGRGTIEIWRSHVELGVARNPGAAFSFLRDAPEAVRRPLFIVVSIAA